MLSQMLIKIIIGEELAERQIILQPELFIRESSGVG
jgi:DNA-binding LacI/PurR family transcriptional regulator